MAKQFRLNASNIFLTYPQVPQEWTHDYVIEKLQAIKPIHTYLVARELHEDGQPHFHVYLKYDKPINTVNPRFFDIDKQHGKYESVRSAKASIIYCLKDGDYKTNIPEEQLCEYTTDKKKPNKDEIYREAKACETADGFKQLIADNCPRDSVIYGSQIDKYADQKYRQPEIYTTPYQDFDIPDDLTKWMETEFYPKKDRRRALVLVSPPNWGKTHWAHSLDPYHMYFRSQFHWDLWDEKSKYIVIDDFDYDHLLKSQYHVLKPLLASDGWMIITDKYKPKMKIFQDKPVIILMNEEDYNRHFSNLGPSLQARIFVVHLKKSLIPPQHQPRITHLPPDQIPITPISALAYPSELGELPKEKKRAPVVPEIPSPLSRSPSNSPRMTTIQFLKSQA